MTYSLLLNVDSYKTSHYLQYPAGTQAVSSYIESRGGEFNKTLFFGLQVFIKQYLMQPITQEQIDEAQAIITSHGLPFNREGWQHILRHHGGYLPTAIEAVAEGEIIPSHNVLLQMINTDEKCAWLTSYLETSLLRAVWYPTTVATKSWHCKQLIKRYLELTADSIDALDFKLHDFGARGASSHETAALGGAAHLINFKGSDTLEAIVMAKRYYQEEMAGFSIPAAEHSTITSWGREGELAAYQNMLTQFAGDNKMVAIVSDSYNLWYAINEMWGGQLKEQVINNGGTVVIRPDSGDPVEVVEQTIEKLMNHFGYSTNSKGYRVLPNYIRVIQGDGISLHSIESILVNLTEKGVSAENITFGMGAELLQKVNRDTHRFAMKASCIKVNDRWRDIYKAPVTDLGKRSKKGRLALINGDSGYETVLKDELQGRENLLQPVYKNGQLLREQTFTDIRSRS